MAVATAGCIWQAPMTVHLELPDTTASKNEVIMSGGEAPLIVRMRLI